jgi:hypothetical protein
MLVAGSHNVASAYSLCSRLVSIFALMLNAHVSAPNFACLTLLGFAGRHGQTHELASRWLAPALLSFFVDIEFTGSHTQFYDKFRYRTTIAEIMEVPHCGWAGGRMCASNVIYMSTLASLPVCVELQYLWTIPAYRASVEEFAAANCGTAGPSGATPSSQSPCIPSPPPSPTLPVVSSKFVHFVNMLLNDAILHMDDAFKKVEEVALRLYAHVSCVLTLIMHLSRLTKLSC